MRILRSSLAVLTLAACSPAEPPTPPDPEAVRASLMAADQAFAAATAQNGLEGWLAAYDSSGIQMEPDAPFTPGIPAIRAAISRCRKDMSFVPPANFTGSAARSSMTCFAAAMSFASSAASSRSYAFVAMAKFFSCGSFMPFAHGA